MRARLWEAIREAREAWADDRAERRARRRMTPDERVLDDMRRHRVAGRAMVDDGFILTEEFARDLMQQRHGADLRSVTFHDGMTTVTLTGGRLIEYDEAGRQIN